MARLLNLFKRKKRQSQGVNVEQQEFLDQYLVIGSQDLIENLKYIKFGTNISRSTVEFLKIPNSIYDINTSYLDNYEIIKSVKWEAAIFILWDLWDGVNIDNKFESLKLKLASQWLIKGFQQGTCHLFITPLNPLEIYDFFVKPRSQKEIIHIKKKSLFNLSVEEVLIPGSYFILDFEKIGLSFPLKGAHYFEKPKEHLALFCRTMLEHGRLNAEGYKVLNYYIETFLNYQKLCQACPILSNHATACNQIIFNPNLSPFKKT